MSPDSSRKTFVLRGLDGTNPLGFLSAVGALTILSNVPQAQAKLAWSEEDVWHPVISINKPTTDDELSILLLDGLRRKTTELDLGDNVIVAQEKFKEHAVKIVGEAVPGDRTAIDLMTNFGCDACGDEESGKIEVTPFCFIKGSGHQYFLKTARDLADCVDREKIRECLFDRWTYNDPKNSMRWDPIEDRRYALMWDNPSGSPALTVWAANLLAYRGLQLFPSVVRDGRLETTGFVTVGRKDYFSWPVWKGLLSIDSVRSVLALKELRVDVPDREKLERMGISDVYRAERLRVGKYANFSPAAPV